ncbi:hypothetical protein HPB52_006226 [Rhipicephalus sanguineus]|uniref:Regulatory protein zeste n=1 Tax=Rhipicephalus sanguineus TaxID=34632 RepID=A0A9D4SRS7_RHISA|nr:hypothetical protein HPB52_006226 [Rhipicephalus sanguineus]
MERRAKVNFTDEERGVLTDLRTDAVSLQRKQRTWDQLATEFNRRQNVHPRTAKPLKKCWDNLKEKWRRAKADDTGQVFKTAADLAIDPWQCDLQPTAAEEAQPSQEHQYNPAGPCGYGSSFSRKASR